MAEKFDSSIGRAAGGGVVGAVPGDGVVLGGGVVGALPGVGVEVGGLLGDGEGDGAVGDDGGAAVGGLTGDGAVGVDGGAAVGELLGAGDGGALVGVEGGAEPGAAPGVGVVGELLGAGDGGPLVGVDGGAEPGAAPGVGTVGDEVGGLLGDGEPEGEGVEGVPGVVGVDDGVPTEEYDVSNVLEPAVRLPGCPDALTVNGYVKRTAEVPKIVFSTFLRLKPCGATGVFGNDSLPLFFFSIKGTFNLLVSIPVNAFKQCANMLNH
ncbi:MAG: hypothetical protein AAGA77_00290 [Bacteroidota bacterium]